MSRRPSARSGPRSPFVVDLRDLGRRPGAMRTLDRGFDVPSGWEAGVVVVPAGSRLDVEGRLESVLDGVLVTGAAHAMVDAECGRCLERLTQPLDLDLQELFVYDPDGEDDVSVVEAETIDLEPMLRDSVILGLPVNPLCRANCPGLCLGCGERIADLPADHTHDDLDPRWAVLAPLSGDARASDRTRTEEN